jgi:hypothetical protein
LSNGALLEIGLSETQIAEWSARLRDIVREILAAEGHAPADCPFVGNAMSDHACASECGLAFLGRAGAGAGANPFPEGTRVVANLLEFFREAPAGTPPTASRAA